MLAGLQPRTTDKRRCGHGGRSDNIRVGDRRLQIISHLHPLIALSQSFGRGAGAVPDGKPRLGKSGDIGRAQGSGHGACTDN